MHASHPHHPACECANRATVCAPCTRAKLARYRTFSLFTGDEFVMCVGRGEIAQDALFHEAHRLANHGQTVEVRPCL